MLYFLLDMVEFKFFSFLFAFVLFPLLFAISAALLFVAVVACFDEERSRSLELPPAALPECRSERLLELRAAVGSLRWRTLVSSLALLARCVLAGAALCARFTFSNLYSCAARLPMSAANAG